MLELLVAVGIIVVLLAVLVPIVGNVTRRGEIAAMNGLMTTTQMGLGGYTQDFSSLPTSTYGGPYNPICPTITNWNGGEILCHALLGPLDLAGDGKAGFGFAVSSKPYGPYIEMKVANSMAERDHDGNGTPDKRYVLTGTSSGKRAAVLYYKSAGTGKTGPLLDATAESNHVWGTMGRFDTDDNIDLVKDINGASADGFIVANYWRVLAGDPLVSESDAFSQTLRSGKYLLVAPGPDDAYGTQDDITRSGI